MSINTYVFILVLLDVSMKHSNDIHMEAWPMVTVYSLTSHVTMDGNYKIMCY